jgi:hypothetical protein
MLPVAIPFGCVGIVVPSGTMLHVNTAGLPNVEPKVPLAVTFHRLKVASYAIAVEAGARDAMTKRTRPHTRIAS